MVNNVVSLWNAPNYKFFAVGGVEEVVTTVPVEVPEIGEASVGDFKEPPEICPDHQEPDEMVQDLSRDLDESTIQRPKRLQKSLSLFDSPIRT